MDAVSGAAKTNVATFFFTLKPWGDARPPGDSSFDLARKLYGMGFGLEQGSFIAFNPPPISGMSNTGGFEMWLQDRNGRGAWSFPTLRRNSRKRRTSGPSCKA